ncbi:glycosyltransferase family 4 protein [Paludibaculum fermentans]|uniref:glycosyltransferase family 4 protein n=1 Tax=Paludibaculum fermentans TaxID=1473598 RepID=UPI003EC005C9
MRPGEKSPRGHALQVSTTAALIPGEDKADDSQPEQRTHLKWDTGRTTERTDLMEETRTVRKIAFVGDHIPRKCGIATFTSDLLGAIASTHPSSECRAVSVTDLQGEYEYPDVVRFEIDEQDERSYAEAAHFLNDSEVEVVCVQHEFGIYGGAAGAHLLNLMALLEAPIVTTLHTVLRQPNTDQRRVMMEIIDRSARLVVMSERGQGILQETYNAPRAKIDLIPHGIPDVPFVEPDCCKGQFGLSGRRVLLTFGLLSPNKGIETVIKALPEIAAEFPDVVYVVLGATHPNELRTRGDAYRHQLEALVKQSGVESNVLFSNRFVPLQELTEYIGAADLYITPYLEEAQITSGTLAYAFGAGKAVISTPYWHAAELLKDQRGVLVPFGDPMAIAREAKDLLRNGSRWNAMRRRAYGLGREMIWSSTARRYMQSFLLAQRPAMKAMYAVAHGSGADVREQGMPRFNREPLWQETDAARADRW